MAESDVLNQGAVNGSQAPRVQSYATKIDPPKEYECSIVQLDSDLLSMNNSRKTLNDSSAAKSRERLRQDFINILEIRSEIDERYQMEPDTSDIYLWNAYIVGQEGTPYAGGIFFFKINFPLDYPFEKPKIVFETRIYHPLIPHTGILKEPHSKTWSSVETPITLFKMIDYIFQNAYKYTKGHQNVSGMAWPETKREFFAKAKEFTRRNASKMKLFETMDDVERHMVRLQLSETSMPSSDATNVYWSKYDNLIQVINKTSELSSGAYNEIFMEDNATVNFIFKCHLYDFIYLQISSIKKYKNSKDPGLTIDEIFSPTGSGVKEINQYLKELPLSAFEEWIDIKEGKDRNHLLTINSGKQKKHYTYE